MFMTIAFATTLPLLSACAQNHQLGHAERSLQDEPTARELQATGETLRVPFHALSNQVRLEATIEGQGPFHLILDTGMPVPGIILFGSERVDALHLADSGARVGLAGGGSERGSTEAIVTKGARLGLGELNLSQVPAMIMPLPPGFSLGGDGIIGGELFFHYVVRIDMDHERLELSQPKLWTPPADACSVPLVNLGGKLFVDVRVAIGEQEPIPASVVVDLGASHSLSLNSRVDGRWAPPVGAIDAPLGRGISGLVLGKAGRARRVELGPFAFENIVTSFPVSEHQKPGGFDFRDGNLGAEILRRFNVTFDYAGSRMVLEKSKHFCEPFEREMLGVSYALGKECVLTILTVLPGSPAAAAGIAVGDCVLAIDGQKIDALGENGVRKALMNDGAQIRLALRRGTETFEKTLRLRRLV